MQKYSTVVSTTKAWPHCTALYHGWVAGEHQVKEGRILVVGDVGRLPTQLYVARCLHHIEELVVRWSGWYGGCEVIPVDMGVKVAYNTHIGVSMGFDLLE